MTNRMRNRHMCKVCCPSVLFLILVGRICGLEIPVGAAVPEFPAIIRYLEVWPFDGPDWLTPRGTAPKASFGVQSVPSWKGQALQINTTPALLTYNQIESNGRTNITCDKGTVSFWFRPDWNSGEGPGTPARLIEIG